MPRWFLLLLPLVACDPTPGATGYEDCDAYDPSGYGFSCEVIDICCEVVGPTDTVCAYVTGDGRRYECLSEYDCDAAAEDVICDVCDMGATTAFYACG
jgi:hypothetical protein